MVDPSAATDAGDIVAQLEARSWSLGGPHRVIRCPASKAAHTMHAGFPP
jgi:hypothetical protein